MLNKWMKKCCKCKIEKPFDAFHKDIQRPDGLQNKCKSCRKQHRLNNIWVFARKDWSIQGIDPTFTPNDWVNLWNEQNGLCPICDMKLDDIPSRNAVVDHNHNTGKVRGILHSHCNWHLDNYKNLQDKDFAARVEEYLP